MAADDFQVHVPELDVINGYVGGKKYHGKVGGTNFDKLRDFM